METIMFVPVFEPVLTCQDEYEYESESKLLYKSIPDYDPQPESESVSQSKSVFHVFSLVPKSVLLLFKLYLYLVLTSIKPSVLTQFWLD